MVALSPPLSSQQGQEPPVITILRAFSEITPQRRRADG